LARLLIFGFELYQLIVGVEGYLAKAHRGQFVDVIFGKQCVNAIGIAGGGCDPSNREELTGQPRSDELV
jgi:hypothetical protein